MAKKHNVVVTQQWANDAVVETSERPDQARGIGAPGIETPLYHAELPALAAYQVANAGVLLKELPVTGLLTIRAKADNASLAPAFKLVLSLDVPGTLQSCSNDDYCLRWMSPDEWLLSAPIGELFEIENKLRKSLTTPVALVNVSGGYTLLELSGGQVLNVLKKSTHYDCHPRNLSVGKVVNTPFAKSQVTLRCLAESHYELVVRRSFADYIWLWLQTASREYGLQVAH
ncbi:MAG: sarcosine oxidase subunit gamma family protein [Granulosicoccaceae bacterium]